MNKENYDFPEKKEFDIRKQKTSQFEAISKIHKSINTLSEVIIDAVNELKENIDKREGYIIKALENIAYPKHETSGVIEVKVDKLQRRYINCTNSKCENFKLSDTLNCKESLDFINKCENYDDELF